MRGTLRHRSPGFAVMGIIPAYAGNTLLMELALNRFRDHPRVCGEHFSRNYWFVRARGSSPRMRGTLPSRLCRVHSSGIIPAYAGNTVKQENPSPPSRDHPRVCGEHYPESAICGHNRGSSPRMRGTLTIELVDGKAGGIIPAYAGNTLSLISPRPCCRDHPRVCGEHSSHSSFVQTR